MKCATCTERNGSTRCEGCQQQYCLPCMIKHHDALAHEFELVANVRNELKESLDSIKLTSENGQTIPCFVEIDRWEQNMIACIRDTAMKARAKVKDQMAQNMTEVHRQFEQLSVDIQKRQKESNFLENDTNAIKRRLEQLKNDVQQVTKKIFVKCTIPEADDFDRWIQVNEEGSPTKSTSMLDMAIDQKDYRLIKRNRKVNFANVFSDTDLDSLDISRNSASRGKQTDKARRNDNLDIEQWLDDEPPMVKSKERSQYVICPTCEYEQIVNSVKKGVRNYCDNCASEISSTSQI